MGTQVLTVSAKGQISIPSNMRKSLSINTGDKLIAFMSDSAILLKPLKLPTVEEFEEELDKAQKWAASVGYKESDIDDIIKDVRNKRKSDEHCN